MINKYSILSLILPFIFFIFFFSCSASFCREAFAEILPDILASEQQIHTIAFVQQSIPLYLYKNVPLSYAINAADLHNDIIAQAQAHPYLHVLSNRDIYVALRNSSSTNHAAAEDNDEIDIGYAENLMSNFNFDAAVTLLKRLTEKISDSQTDYLSPKYAARAYQMLAYSYIEQSREHPDNSPTLRTLARQAFTELIRIAPHIMMLEGRQSQDRVEIYNEALDLFLGEERSRQMTQQDGMALANKLGAEQVVLMRIVQSKFGALTLEIDRYDTYSHNVYYDKIPIEMNGIANADELNQRISNEATSYFSNTYACLKSVSTSKNSKNSFNSDFFMFDFLGAFSMAVRHPTSNPIAGAGAKIDLGYMFTEHFFARVGFELIINIPNDDHELYDVFETFSFPLEIGISQNWNMVSIYLATGAELSFTSDYIITKSITCKAFGKNDIECLPGDVTDNRDPFSLLVPFTAGISIGRSPFFFILELTVSATVYPIKDSAFKHPWGSRFGVQYRFK